MKRRRRAEHALQDALASVEQQVADRTEALSQAITEVKRSEQQFRLITELSPVHLFRATPDGEAIFLSPGFLVMTGLNHNQARGFGWIDAVHPDDRGRLMAGWHEALHSQAIFQAEFRFRAAAGDFRWFRARIAPERDEASGAVIGWVGAAIDLHELHLALDERAAALDRAGEWPTDVLLCDVGLPDDDGYGLLRRLRLLPEGADIPAIALTAYARPEDRARALAAGFRAHLSKPFEPGRLLREISSAITPQAPH